MLKIKRFRTFLCHHEEVYFFFRKGPLYGILLANENTLFHKRIPCDLAVKAPASRVNDRRFQSYREPTTLGESCGWSTMSNDHLERTIAGSRAPMVLNHSRCVVLGSGPA